MDFNTSVTPASILPASLLAPKKASRKWPAAILAGTIAPAILITSASAVDLVIPPNATINSDAGTAIYTEGLKEGKTLLADDETTVNPENSSPELTLRLGQLNQNPGGGQIPDGWGNPSTWIYTGQIKVTTSFLAFAANVDDDDWLKINGTVVLDDNEWNTPIQANAANAGNNQNAGQSGLFGANENLVAGLGLVVGEWYDFEYRGSDAGGGGAGPSGQGVGWNNTYGVGMNTTGFKLDGITPLGNSVDGNDYVKPEEIAGGGPDLFRYFVGTGLNDDLRVTASGTLTIDGVAGGVSELSLRFENPAPATFTINDGTGAHKTLGVLGSTQWATAASAGAGVTLAGTSDLRPGAMTDNGITVTVTQAGPGSLILDSATPSTVGNTTFSAVGGLIVISGTSNPIPGAKLRIDNVGGNLRIGGSATFNNTITASAAGTLSKTDNTTSTVSGAVALGATPLNVDVTAGTLRLSGAVSGNGFVKSGGGTFETSLALTTTNATVTGGTFRTVAGATINNVSVSGGTFETNGTTTIPTGGTVSITGGTFRANGALTLNGTASLTQSAGDLITGVSAPLTISGAGSSLNLNGGTITTNGTVTITNANVGGGLFRSIGNATITNLSMTGGRFAALGALTLTNLPTVGAGATLALRGSGNNIGGGAINVAGGTYEIVPGAASLLGVAKAITVSGGVLALDSLHGLNAHIYNTNPNSAGADPDRYNPDFGPQALTPGSNGDIGLYTTLFSNLESGAGPRVTTTTTAGGLPSLNFPTTTGAPFAALGAGYTDSIQSRFDGQFNAPVAGTYTFETTSDDGSVLFIDGVSIVYNNRYQGMTPRNGMVNLSAGLHAIEIGHFEGGGGAGLIVSVTKPGSGKQDLNNADLFLSNSVPTFDNVITASAAGGVINVLAPRAIAQNVVVPNGSVFGASGNKLTIEALDLTGATSTTFNIANETTVLKVTDGGDAVGIVKTGAGTLVFDEPAIPQFQNAGSTIAVNQGALGILIGGGNNPTGNANITFNGGGVVLSSKDGLNHTYPAPNFTNGGVLAARVIGSGVAGTVGTPIVMTITGNLQVGAGNTLNVSTADNYELTIGGAASGSGTVAISGGVINSTTNTAFQGLNIVMSPLSGGDPAILKLQTNSPTVKSLSTTGGGTSQIIVGNGLAPATLSLTGPDSPNVTRFAGDILENGGQPVTLNAAGSGTLILAGNSSFNGGVTTSAGTLELASNTAAGFGPVTLNGGTLQFSNPGLQLKLYNSDPNASGAYTAGVLNSTLANVTAHYAAIGVPAVTTTTAADGNTSIVYPVGANAGANLDGAPFAIHGFGSADNIEALFSGRFDAGAGGVFRFSPRSDDGTTIYIDGALLVDNNFAQGINEAGQAPRDQNINLTPGLHDIVITYNEGNGGAGLYVDYTPPGGARQVLTNGSAGAPILSTTQFFNSTNAVNLTASSTLNLRNGDIKLGVLTQTPGTTLTTTAGTVTFPELVLATAGTYTIGGPGTVVLNQITDSGNSVTINRNGGGTLLLGLPASPQLSSGTSVFNISGGSSLVAVGDFGVNPLGNAAVNLSGGSALKLSSTGSFVDFANPVTLSGNATISAGNFGGGALNFGTTNLTSPVVVGAGNTLTVNSSSNFTLGFGDGFGGGGISGAGNVLMTGGTVSANENINIGGNLSVTGGRLTGNKNITANQIDITTGTLAANGNLTTTAGTNVNSKGVLELRGFPVSGPVNVNGGTIFAAQGVTNVGALSLNIAPTSVTNNPDKLRASLYLVTGTGVNVDNGVNNIIPGLNPLAAVDLTVPIDNPQGPNADANFTALFGGAGPNAANFTAVSTGYYTANATGTHQFNITGNDDTAVVWLDLNHNGIFESNGSAGSELLVNLGCCNGNAPKDVQLLSGEKYRVLIAVEDTGGASGLVAHFTNNGGIDTIVAPGDPGQAGIWSYETVTGGGTLSVADSAEITAAAVTNGRITVASNGRFSATQLVNNQGIVLTAGPIGFGESRLTLTNTVPTVSSTQSLTVSGFGGNASIVSLDANSTLNVTYLAVSPGTTLTKDGAGTLTALNQTLGNGSTLAIQNGLVNLRGDVYANNAGANDGAVTVNGASSTLNLIRSINGQITLDSDGTLQAAGSFILPGQLNIGFDGGIVDTEGFNITVTGGVNGFGGELRKIDNGTLSLSGVINLGTLSAEAGTTRLGSSATLDALVIGGGATVVLDAAPPAPAFAEFAAGESLIGGGAGQQAAIPEPGSVGLLLVGVLGLLGRRRRD